MIGFLPFGQNAAKKSPLAGENSARSLRSKHGKPSEKTDIISKTQMNGFYDPQDSRIFYKFSTRARRISMRIQESAREVIVTVPGERALPKAQKFVQDKMDWINVHLENLPEPQPFFEGGTLLFEGEAYKIIVPGPRGRAVIDRANKEIIIPSTPDNLAARGHRLLKREARIALEEATHFYADQLGKTVAKISLRDSRTRWGSCISRQGEGYISYSWRLVCAPPFVLDYVCAHECAHMIHADHSANFWALTEKIFPETEAAKRWLKRNGSRLYAVGVQA